MKQPGKITLNMIKRGILFGIVRPVLEDSGLVCHIGDNWFYFGGVEFEYTDPKEIPLHNIVHLIRDTLDAFRTEDETADEYAYYFWVLKEHGC